MLSFRLRLPILFLPCLLKHGLDYFGDFSVCVGHEVKPVADIELVAGLAPDVEKNRVYVNESDLVFRAAI
jgi:hypothetical protein